MNFSIFPFKIFCLILDTEFNSVRDEVQETTRKEFQKISMIQQHTKNQKHLKLRSKIICLAIYFVEIRSKYVMQHFNEVQIHYHIFFIEVKVSIVHYNQQHSLLFDSFLFAVFFNSGTRKTYPPQNKVRFIRLFIVVHSLVLYLSQ